MKEHTTNYYDTFIEIAEDCPSSKGEMPPVKGEKLTIANLQFDLLYDNPYKYTSDEVIFGAHAQKQGFLQTELDEQRQHFFSKGQACFRASPLTKKYGWGVHSNSEGRVAIYSAGSEEYNNFLQDNGIKKVKAMRTSRK